MDAFETVAAIGVAAAFLYLKVRLIVSGIRTLKQSRDDRVVLCIVLAGLLLSVGSCALVERATGISADATPRRTLSGTRSS